MSRKQPNKIRLRGYERDKIITELQTIQIRQQRVLGKEALRAYYRLPTGAELY